MNRLPFTTDSGSGARAAFGIIVLQTDETLEGECRRIFDLPGVALFCSRIAMAAEVSAETLAQMQAELPQAAGLLPATGLAAVGYACTSGATIIGEDKVTAILQAAQPGAAATNPLTAVKAALRALHIRRLAFVTPYAPAVSVAMRRVLEEAGVVIAGFGSFNESDDRVVARISSHSCLEAIVRTAGQMPCDGVLIACTNLRVLDVIEEAEARLGMPVISSNQALAWHMLRLAGIADVREGFGMLLKV